MSLFKDNRATGLFKHKETKAQFEFRPTKYWWAIEHDLPYEIAVAGSVVYARIGKTVAYVAVDEDQDGGPVLEKWAIKILWRLE